MTPSPVNHSQGIEFQQSDQCCQSEIPAALLNAQHRWNNYPGNQLTYSSPTYETDPRYSVRGDYELSSKDHIFFRFYRNDDGPYVSNNGGSDKFGSYSGTGIRTRNYARSWTRQLKSSAVNEFLVGFNQEADPRTDQNHNVDPSSLVPGIPTPPPGAGGLPTIAVSGINSITSAGSNFDNHQHILQINDNFRIVRGAHSLKAGAQFISQETGQGGTTLGSFSFDGRFTGHYRSNGFATLQAVNPVNAFADFLLADMTSSSTASDYNVLGKRYAIYAQDNWFVSPKLTLNLGLRYEKSFPLTRDLGGISNFYPDLNALVLVSGTPSPALVGKYSDQQSGNRY
jgi:outer membrane receptor protein involved in Fe transport